MAGKLTPEQVTALQSWIDDSTAIMRLGHWRIRVEQTVKPKCYGGSFIRDSSDTSDLYLGDLFWKEDAEGQRETLTHELLHCHLYRLHTFIWDHLKPANAKTARTMEEIAIEQLARIVAPLLPLPNIPRSA